ncbi:MAG: VCBS repeat-containing protein [Ardenticatenaceae bacterium]|nr:VCBS repeat-containing protein [Ardenticatenaceae bacterium]
MSKFAPFLILLILLLALAAALNPSISTASPEADTDIYLPIVFNPISAPTLKWQKGGCQTTWCRTGWYASPAVADLDGDSKPEVIGVDYRVVVVNGETGSDQWVVASPGGSNRSWPGVVVADVDNNSSLEIVSAYGDGYLSVLNANGTAYSGWPKQVTPGNELRSLAVDDVDGNNDLEILVCSTRSDDQWFLFNHTGSNYHPNWPVHYPDDLTNGFAAGCFNENVGLADLDKDGRSEMIGPNDTHYVVGYNDDATPIYANPIYGLNKPWARVGFHLSHEVDLRGYAQCDPGDPLEPRPNFADSAPTFADVNHDGTLEIIIIGNQYDCRTSPYTSLYQLPYILNVDRTRWSGNGYNWTVLPIPDSHAGPLSENYNVIETVQPNPVAADLDGDGFLEILYASYDGRIHAYWLDKTEHGTWPYEVTQAGEGIIRFASEPIVVDLDNNGKAEVIFNTWTQIGSSRAGELIILNWDGSLLHRITLPRSSQSWDGALSAPTIANIDNDADYEIVVSTAYTGLVAYDLPGTVNAHILWGTGRGSYLRTGQALP